MHRTALFLALAMAGATPAGPARHVSGGPVSDARAIWSEITGYITQSAQDMSDADYAYRPTPEVRTFGQLIAHIAGSQHLMCAAALGEAGGSEDDIEKTKTSKSDIVAALRASNEYCARAYAQTDDQVTASSKLFGEEHSRLYALILNATHDNEHYGNIVTYMRLKGMVPPSSRPRSGQ